MVTELYGLPKPNALGLHWILNIRPHEYEASTFTTVLQRIWYISVNFTFNLEKQ